MNLRLFQVVIRFKYRPVEIADFCFAKGFHTIFTLIFYKYFTCTSVIRYATRGYNPLLSLYVKF